MLAFVGGAFDAGAAAAVTAAPRLRATAVALAPPAAAEGSFGQVSFEGVAFAVAAVGVLALSMRRRSRVALRAIAGYHGGTSDMPGLCEILKYRRYRAKAGDKFRRRKFLDSRYSGEWGHFPPENEDRVAMLGRVFFEGTPQGPINYAKKQAEQERMDVRRQATEISSGALLVNCDGALAETERDGHRVAFNKAFKEKGFDCQWDVDLYGKLLNVAGGKERLVRYFASLNRAAWPHAEAPRQDHPDICDLYALKMKNFEEVVRSGAVALRPGVEELLTAAAAAGWPVAVCTTGDALSAKIVVDALLPELASYVRIFAADAEVFDLAAQEIGVAPMKCVVLEDSSAGAQAAKDACMNVVVTKSSYAQEGEDYSSADVLKEDASEIDVRTLASLLPSMLFA